MLNFKDNFYKKLYETLDVNAVMMRVEEDGTYYPIWCSHEFTEMMEGTEEDFIRLESGGTMSTIHPDDHSEVAYLFRNHITKDGINSLTIRKKTVRGNWIWVCVHAEGSGDRGCHCPGCRIGVQFRKGDGSAE